MIVTPSTCPICGHSVNNHELRCSQCRCIIQFSLERPLFSRTDIDETLVQQTIDGYRAQITTNPQDGIAHYILGICYLNYTLLDQGMAELEQAATLLPEKHTIRFEIAILQSVPGQYALGLDQITQALKLAPENRDYQYLQHYLSGMVAHVRQEIHPAVTSWIMAYQLAPDHHPAKDMLLQFISTHETKLTQPNTRSLSNLDSQDAAKLQMLYSPAPRHKLPREPKAPRKLGTISMGILRKVSMVRAAMIDQMHTERIAAYQAAMELYKTEYQRASEQGESMYKAWETQVQTTRNDVPFMARLCLAIVEEEERRRQEMLRRQAEIERKRQEEQQRRQEEQQRRQEEQSVSQKTPSVPTKQPKVREKQHLSTKAQYVQGLPKGREKDPVTLTVTNLQITVKHNAMFGGWEHTIPMTALAEITPETIKHLLSSEKRLRISYRDEQGMIAHAVFTGLNVDVAVKKVLQARSGA